MFSMKRLLAGAMLLCAIACSGCGIQYPELPDNATALETGSYTDTGDDDAMYRTLTYEGRLYLPYGTLGESLYDADIDQCIGYVAQDDRADDTNIRVYTLTADPQHHFLMETYIGESVMEQPSFWRAADTKGSSVPMPDYIEPLEYNFWKD